MPRARILARALVEAIAGSAVNVYSVGTVADQLVWIPRAAAGEQTIRGNRTPANEGTLARAAGADGPLVLEAAVVSREEYAHLDIRRTLKALAYVPLRKDDSLAGMIE